MSSLSTRATRRSVLLFAAGGAFTLLAAGCGGGGSSSGSSLNGGPGGTPTTTTRARVSELHQMSLRGLTQAGFHTAAFGPNYVYAGSAAGLGSADNASGSPVPTAAPSAVSGVNGVTTAPNVGAFLHNIAAASPATRGIRIRASKQTRQEPEPEPTPTILIAPDPYPGPVDPAPSFYYDYYLGLWVDVVSTSSTMTYRLYEDEAKTQPAGSIDTIQPADWNTFPQVFESTYSFTAGFSAGSHGHSKNVTNADYSSTSEYDNTYPDGWTDSGNSRYDAQGNSTWTSRTETGNGQWSESSGSFRADGSGGTRTRTSDGYEATYVYNRDGTGHGRITGNDPGLPVTISWDAYGNTTTTYADGTIEHTPGWGGYGYGYGEPIPVEGDGGIGNTVTSTASASPVPALTP